MSAQRWEDLGIEVPSGRYGEVDTTCPQCSASRKKSRVKCLSINTESGIYHCHHCGWAGALAGGGTAPRPISAAPRSYRAPKPPPPDAGLDADAIAWFARRGIPEWALEDAGVTVGQEFSPTAGQHVRALRFPYWRDGQLVNIKYRGPDKDFWMVGGAERILYGLDGAQGAETLVIVEGEIDKLSIDAVHGWPTLSVPDGAPSPTATNYASKFTFLEGAEDLFRQAKTVILATDADAPGQKLAEELARRIGYAKCRRVVWPEGHKDANEVLVGLGPTALQDALDDAQPYPVAGIVTVRELAGPLEALYEGGLDRGKTTGFDRFDTLLRARGGLLTIVTGKPGDGKSVFLDNLMVRLAERHGWRFAVCSPENQPLERHLANILSIATGEPFGDGPTPRMSRETMRQARQWAEHHFAFVLPEEPTVDAILERADTLLYRMGINGLVVDPWTELDHSRPASMTADEYHSQSLSRLRSFARRSGCQVWLAAHPTKLEKDPKTKVYPVPTLYNISGSSHFANKADAGFAVWRDATDPSKPTEIHVQKVRFGETGQLGIARFTFDRATSRFREAL